MQTLLSCQQLMNVKEPSHKLGVLWPWHACKEKGFFRIFKKSLGILHWHSYGKKSLSSP